MLRTSPYPLYGLGSHQNSGADSRPDTLELWLAFGPLTTTSVSRPYKSAVAWEQNTLLAKLYKYAKDAPDVSSHSSVR